MKRVNFLFKLMIISGIFIILGTAGASDLERIGFWETVSQLLISGMLIVSGKLGLKVSKVKPAIIRKRTEKSKRIAVRQAKAA